MAPVSWLVRRDVDEGRDELNFSEWDFRRNKTEDAAETILEGEMPPWFYVMLHPNAYLSKEEKAALAQDLERMSGSNRSGGD